MKTAADGARDFIDGLKRRKDSKVVSTGFRNLDRYLVGLVPGELLLVGARPGTGKSAFLMQLGEAVARQGVEALFLSLEMSEEQLQARLLGSLAGVELSALRSGKLGVGDMTKLEHWAQAPWLPLLSTEDRTYTLDGIEACMRRAREERPKLALVVVDYIQRVRVGSRSSSRDAEIGIISSKLKELAKELQVCLVSAAQLNRSIESKKEGPRKPQLSDLRESGCLEQDADVVMILTRERDEAILHILKNRSGEHEVECYYDFFGDACRFVEKVGGGLI